jgi:DNA-binding protein H-NS
MPKAAPADDLPEMIDLVLMPRGIDAIQLSAASEPREGYMASTIDLEKLTIEELKTLSKDIERTVKKRGTESLRKAREAAEAAVREFGFSLEEILGSKAPGRGPKQSQAKYRNPVDPNQTWSGRGRQPQWFKDAVAGGRALEELAA